MIQVAQTTRTFREMCVFACACVYVGGCQDAGIMSSVAVPVEYARAVGRTAPSTRAALAPATNALNPNITFSV